MSEPLLVVEQGSRAHRTWQTMQWAVVVILVLLVPIMLEPFEIGKMNRAIVLGVAVLSINLVVGFAGLLALGHSAFMGVGAFIAASMVQDENWDYWMVIPVVLIVGFLVGVITGLPALRVKGLYLALVTIAMAFVFPTLVNLDQWGIARRTGGPNGRKVSEEVTAPDWVPSFVPGGKGEDILGPRGGSAYRYYLLVIIAALVWLLVRNMIRSRAGRAIIAIRDNETGAAVSGVNLPLYKTINFGISAAIGTLAGLMWSLDKGFVAGQDFTFLLAIDLIIGLVIGGVGTLQGSIIGGIFVVWVKDLTKKVSVPLGFYTLDGNGPLANATFGIILILFTFFAPGGIVSLARLARSRIIRVIPQPPPPLEAAEAPAQEAEATPAG